MAYVPPPAGTALHIAMFLQEWADLRAAGSLARSPGDLSCTCGMMARNQLRQPPGADARASREQPSQGSPSLGQQLAPQREARLQTLATN